MRRSTSAGVEVAAAAASGRSTRRAWRRSVEETTADDAGRSDALRQVAATSTSTQTRVT